VCLCKKRRKRKLEKTVKKEGEIEQSEEEIRTSEWKTKVERKWRNEKEIDKQRRVERTRCPDAKPGRRGGKRATNRLSYGRAMLSHI
jgi:hypothetical protein